MKKVTVHNKQFVLMKEEREIVAAIKKTADKINHDLRDSHPLFVSILNGAFMFTAELMKHIDIPDAEISFVKLSSYSAMQSTGKVSSLIGLNQSIKGRNVVILEDMVDSGLSMHYLVEQLQKEGAESISISALFVKPDAMKYPVDIKYPVMELGLDFVVGYGLDYDGHGRQYPDLYILDKQ